MSVIDNMLAYVDRQIGKSYSQANRWGENSFDCSSLVYRAFDAAGVKLVHKDTGGKVCISSDECYAKGFELLYPDSYAKIGKNLPSPSSIVDKYKAGDIIFCCTDNSTSRANKITHVMIVNQYGGITHAANPRDGVGKVPQTTYATKVCALLRYQGEGYTGSATGGAESSEIKDLGTLSRTLPTFEKVGQNFYAKTNVFAIIFFSKRSETEFTFKVLCFFLSRKKWVFEGKTLK